MTNVGSIDAVVSKWLASVKITVPIPHSPQGQYCHTNPHALLLDRQVRGDTADMLRPGGL